MNFTQQKTYAVTFSFSLTLVICLWLLWNFFIYADVKRGVAKLRATWLVNLNKSNHAENKKVGSSEDRIYNGPPQYARLRCATEL